MSEDGGFLSRWSRRKQAVGRGDAAPDDGAGEAVPKAGPEAAPVLPPIEGLGAGSDYSAFLQKGVAAVVQQAALRRAWTSDAGIATFRGMADYDWDFNAASYGRLRATDSVAELLKGVLGVPEPVEAAEWAGPAVRLSEPVVAAVAEPALEVAEVEPACAPAPVPRRHGSAMPS